MFSTARLESCGFQDYLISGHHFNQPLRRSYLVKIHYSGFADFFDKQMGLGLFGVAFWRSRRSISQMR